MMLIMMNVKPANATKTSFDEKAHFELFSTAVWQSTTVDHIVHVFSSDGGDGDDGTVDHVVHVLSDEWW